VNKTFAVIRREFVERVRTKAFVISTLLIPILMIGLMVVPVLMLSGGDRTQHVAIVDGSTDGLGDRIEASLARSTFSRDGAPVPRYDLSRIMAGASVESVRDSLIKLTGLPKGDNPESFDGVLVITNATTIEGKAAYYGSNVGSPETMSRLEGAVSQAVRSARLEMAGVDTLVVAAALIPTNMTTTKVDDGKPTGASGEASFMLAYAMGLILYIAIMVYGQQTGTSVVEEKTSRIMEVVAASLRPFQMLMGKIVGVGLAGLLQLGIWGGSIFLLSSQRGRIAGLFGIDPAAVQAMQMPNFPPDLLVIFLLYFALGFLLYGALYAAIGSMVNSVQEVQQMATPVTMLVIFGFFGIFAVIKDASAGIAVTLSLIPFFAPFVMPVRWSMATVPMSHLLLSLVLMVIGLAAVAWFAGRIYRTGILMYGKKPSLREIFRWVRVS
jgi:ABC-2 type transport system permease protein